MTGIKPIKQLEREGFRMVAECETGWVVFASVPNEAGWSMVRLRRCDGVKKRTEGRRSYHLNWNGERFALTSEFATVPHSLVTWAEQQLAAHQGAAV
jgi:hypothetical protein